MAPPEFLFGEKAKLSPCAAPAMSLISDNYDSDDEDDLYRTGLRPDR